MKKLGKFLIVAGCAAMACAALAGCGSDPVDYKGGYKYTSEYGDYGVNVTVTVEGDKITKVVCDPDTDTMHNITPTWKEDSEKGQLGHDKTVAALPDYLKKFEGMKVADVKALNVSKDDNGQPNTDEAGDASQGALLLTGATQTSGRIILAVQDALKDVK